MTPGIANEGVHVICGDSAAGTFKQAFHVLDRLLVSRDILSCGPVPEWSDFGRWRDVREDYLKALVPDGQGIEFGTGPHDLLSNLHRLREHVPIYVWAGTGVEDQLLIAFAARLIAHVGGDPLSVRLLQFESLPGRRSLIRGMGELNPDQVRAHPQPRQMTEALLAQYRAAWRALTSTTPELLASFREQNEYLNRAMGYLPRRYPQKSSGLSYWDFQILAEVEQQGPSAARIVGHALSHDLFGGDAVGDWYLFWRLRRMAEGGCPRPLLSVTGAKTSLRGTQVSLTAFGAEVLEGRASSYPANPIHDWVGGVELSSSTGALWFNDGGRIVQAS